jgi:hypothetical protein
MLIQQLTELVLAARLVALALTKTMALVFILTTVFLRVQNHLETGQQAGTPQAEARALATAGLAAEEEPRRQT